MLIEPSHLKAAQNLLIEMEMKTTLSQSTDRNLDALIGGNPESGALKEAAKVFLNRYMSWDAVKDDLAMIYADAFTEEELTAITAFYQTPAGKKMAILSPELIGKGLELGQQRVQEHIAELQSMILNAINKEDAHSRQSAPPILIHNL
jgi:hypothetical protein